MPPARTLYQDSCRHNEPLAYNPGLGLPWELGPRRVPITLAGTGHVQVPTRVGITSFTERWSLSWLHLSR